MVALLEVRNAGSNGIDDARTLVTEHDWHRDAGMRAVVGVETAVAYAAGHHLDANLAETWLVELELEHLHLFLWLHEHWCVDQHDVPLVVTSL